MNKKEVVVEAYGPYYLALSEFIDDEGWCNAVKDVDGIRFKFKRQERMLEWRPASLGLVDENYDDKTLHN